jgi:hypothetical protein
VNVVVSADAAVGRGSPRRRAGGVLIAWFGLALIAGATGTAARLRPPAPQVVVVLLTVALLVLERGVAWARAAVASVSLPKLVAVHVTRFAGLAFLPFAWRGELPRAFAYPAAIGDVLVALTAILLIAARRPAAGRFWNFYFAWNVLGLIELALVVVNAARFALADPASMGAMLRLPLFLLPGFLVPYLLAGHVWMLRRLLALRTAA